MKKPNGSKKPDALPPSAPKAPSTAKPDRVREIISRESYESPILEHLTDAISGVEGIILAVQRMHAVGDMSMAPEEREWVKLERLLREHLSGVELAREQVERGQETEGGAK